MPDYLRNLPWTKERIAKRSATVRANSIGHIRIQNGYRQVLTAEGYRYEHRVLMSAILCRKLATSEVVHHKNGIKTDNRPENLEIISPGEHSAHHYPQLAARDHAADSRLKPGQWARWFPACVGCGTTERPHLAKGKCGPCYRRGD